MKQINKQGKEDIENEVENNEIDSLIRDYRVTCACYKDKITMDEGKSHSQEKKTFENSYVC